MSLGASPAETARQGRAEVRNPVLALPAVGAISELAPEVRALLAQVLEELATDARARAEQCWRKHKAPMAAYWKAVAVYARHIARVLRRGPRRAGLPTSGAQAAVGEIDRHPGR